MITAVNVSGPVSARPTFFRIRDNAAGTAAPTPAESPAVTAGFAAPRRGQPSPRPLLPHADELFLQLAAFL